MSKYFQFPTWKILYRCINKAIYSEIIGSMFFSIFAVLFVIDSRDLFQFSLESALSVLFSWIFSLIIAALPAAYGGVTLSCLIYADLKRKDFSKRKSIRTGFVAGTSIAFVLALITISISDGDSLIISFAVLAIIIAAFCGGWTGWKIFDDFSKKVEGAQNG